ncbi:response regulator [Nocardioides sp. HDW12B]|uniref:response regulator n=1 Tax=Nocardioides sp. HDW12B TaxID=2714939 RepID=UPI001408F8E1|nr:response regulator [Nocardioides sp. HDW12B]QIK67677.1 response regulator [Nocardioides sp. HDW12B]
MSSVSGSEPPAPDSAPLRVLAVEDNPELREYLTLELQDAELIAGRSTAVTVAPDLQHAIEVIHGGGVDLVLLDLGLPDSSGLDTVFRVSEVAPAIPVVVVTGSVTEEQAEQVLLAGAQDFLVKGTFSGAALQRLLRFVLARHRHTLELFTSMAHNADDDDLTRLESLGAAGVGVASRSLGRVTLAETYPEAFASARDEYSQLVHSRLEERGLHVDYQVSSRTRAVAWDLGHLRATPRDVVDVHLAAVRALTEGKGRTRARALLRSGEGLLTETLGHLAAFYRAQALGRPSGRGGPAAAEAREDQS